MNTNARIGVAIVGFLVITGIAIFACAERATSESNEETGLKKKSGSAKRVDGGVESNQIRVPGSPMEQDKGSEQVRADKAQAIETP